MNFKSNIPKSIEDKIGLNHHNQKGHPIKIIKEKIYKYFDTLENEKFDKFDNFNPFVSIVDNFDLLRIPKDHPARKLTDTYYKDFEIVLRTHTTAHQNQLFSKGYKNFLVTGDVYRKDEIDSRHFPMFYQTDGVFLINDKENPEQELKKRLANLIDYLFPGKEYRFNEDYFPFTDPSFEMEVKFDNKWLEILGCGLIHQEILDKYGIQGKYAAFGLGISRLAMILFNIPDIRYLYETDARFLDQFEDEQIKEFKPYPKLKAISKDISFWINEKEIKKIECDFDWLNINNFYEIIRNICGNNIKEVIILDKFFHKTQNKYSLTFRLLIESLEEKDPGMLNSIANNILNNLKDALSSLNYDIR
ncbi:Phenylalanyl-tRNA synthetase [uncultured virus]|nr:Phenylalanyl-tRNA synthetase [uncultured virus]